MRSAATQHIEISKHRAVATELMTRTIARSVEPRRLHSILRPVAGRPAGSVVATTGLVEPGSPSVYRACENRNAANALGGAGFG